MSSSNLGKRLQPAMKAWKSFTSNLRTKLCKLNRSKVIKKTTNRFIRTHLQLKRQTIQTTNILHCYHLQRQPQPVFIDQLFVEPVSVVEEHLQPPHSAAKNKGVIRESSSLDAEKAEHPYHVADDGSGTNKEVGSGTNKEVGKGRQDRSSAADDMWESLALASPLMHGINERAEEFINRIRAEMQLQELRPHG